MVGVLTSLGTGVAVSLIVFFVTRYYSDRQAKKAAEMEHKEAERLAEVKANREKIDAIAELSVATAQIRIMQLGEKYLTAGCVTTVEKTIIQGIYEPYKRLGGNGIAENIMAEVEKLPVVVEEGGVT